MKLIFNPCYDAKVLVKTEGCVMGEKVVGPQGLLDELELRAGLTGRYLDDFQRAILYARALKKVMETKAEAFFAKSFERDKLGTAVILLRWRDALVKTGWESSMTGSSRLDDLALAERWFGVKGEGDRWQQLLGQARKDALLEKDDSIEVTCGKEALEPLYRQLLEALEKQGCHVCYRPAAADEALHAEKDVLQFKNDIEMAEWLAQQALDEGDAVVCDDTSILNLVLALEDKPQVGMRNHAIGSIMQIFTLGLELFNNPVDVNALLAYLQLPATPLSAVAVKWQDDEGKDKYTSLRRMLFAQLLKDNGIGGQWKDLIDEAVYDFDGNDLSKSDKRKRALLFVDPWTRSSGSGAECTVDKATVVEFVKEMKGWAKGNLHDEERASQFNAIVDNCDTMLLILEDEGDTVKTHDLKLWAAQISRPVELATLTARKGSIEVTNAVTNLHSAPARLYWDCTMKEYRFRHELDFLTPGETDILKRNGIVVDDRETLLKRKREMTLAALRRVKERIVMLECEVRGGTVAVEDPVATEVRLGGKLKTMPTTPDMRDMVTKPVEAGSTKKGEYKFEKGIVFKRDSESYSSLETLIQRPFDYVMDYILGMKEYGKEAMAGMDTLKGNVAHKYIELLTDQGARDVATMRTIHSSQFDANLDQLARTNGALLLMEENELEFKRFKSLLQRSVDNLLDIIESNGLTIVGPEQKYEADIDDIGNMNATIDYVLRDRNGDYVIFDFKWNEGMAYKDKLEENDALQLAVYKTVLEKHLKDEAGDKGPAAKVSFMGYYVLPRHTLYTTYTTLSHKSIEVVAPKDTHDLMPLARNSYKYRMEQLWKGLIEEGEDLLMADLEYWKDTATKGLYPLRPKYGTTDTKGIAYRNKNIVLKGGLV